METSLRLHLAPEKGRRDQVEDFVPDWSRQDLTPLGMKRISPRGVWRHPSGADPGKGERWFRQAVDYSVGRVRALIQTFQEAPGPEPLR